MSAVGDYGHYRLEHVTDSLGTIDDGTHALVNRNAKLEVRERAEQARQIAGLECTNESFGETLKYARQRAVEDKQRIAELEADRARKAESISDLVDLAEQADAERRALKDRRCEGCEQVRHHAVGTPHAYRLCRLGNSFGYDAALPDDYACNRWAAHIS